MRCGILTFHRAINYGGVLQSFALTTALKKKNVEVEIIDYYCPAIENLYRGKNIFSLTYIKHFASAVLQNGTLFFNNEGFKTFRYKYLTLSADKYYSIDDLNRCVAHYDRFITGSDQIWSPTCAGFDKAYFLPFIDDSEKKYSYAASFGVSEIRDNLKGDYKQLLSSFKGLSVREQSGADIINDIIGKRAEVHLDPTFLLTADEWNRLLTFESSRVKKPFILIYSIGENQKLIDEAIKEGKMRGYDVVYISDRVHKKKDVINLRKTSPDEWVWLISNAYSVYTNSYHGLAFCINFKKDVHVMYLESNTAANTRIECLLQTFGMENCVIGQSTNCGIDYNKIESVLHELREKADSYLNMIVVE